MTATTAARPAFGSDDAARVVAELRSTFATGTTRPVEWREEQLARLDRMLVEHEDAFLDALADDLGKPTVEAWATDLGFVRNEIADLRHRLPSFVEPERVRLPLTARPGRARIIHEPLGVCLVIAPWNYPVQLLLVPMAAAIAAGNCVVGKPSELTPATSALLARLVPEHLDPSAVRIVEGAVPETTALLDRRWDHIFFTGSTPVGRIVMRAAAEHLTPVTLELGGKSPAIVDRSADVRVAARRIAWGKFLNAGQTCVAPDHVLVHADVEDELVAELTEAVEGFYGADPRRSDDYARIVSERHAERLRGLLEGDGAGVPVLGGVVDVEARYVAPTLLRSTRLDSAVMAEEIFGPLLPIIAVDDVDEAIGIVVAGEKPLALYAFGDDEVTERILAGTSAGGVTVNHTVLHLGVPDLPFGGVGESGMGAYHGRASLETFSHAKSVLSKPTRPDPPLIYPPYTGLKERLIRRFF